MTRFHRAAAAAAAALTLVGCAVSQAQVIVVAPSAAPAAGSGPSATPLGLPTPSNLAEIVAADRAAAAADGREVWAYRGQGDGGLQGPLRLVKGLLALEIAFTPESETFSELTVSLTDADGDPVLNTSTYIGRAGVTQKNVLVPKAGDYYLKVEARRGVWQVLAQQAGRAGGTTGDSTTGGSPAAPDKAPQPTRSMGPAPSTEPAHAVPQPAPRVGTVVGTYAVGGGAADLALDAAGNAWVAGSGTVTKLSPAGQTLGTYDVGGGSARRIALDGGGNAWIVLEAGDAVVKLSPAGETLGTYAVGKAPWGIAIDAGGNAWVTLWGTHSVTKLSPTGQTLGTFAVGRFPADLAIDAAGNAWVVSGDVAGTVTKLSAAGAPLGSYAAGSSPWGVAIDAGSHVWVAGLFSTVKLSPTGERLGSYDAGSGIKDLALDAAGDAWVTSRYDGTVTRLSAAGEPLETYALGPGAERIAVDAHGHAWVANGDGGSVTKLGRRATRAQGS